MRSVNFAILELLPTFKKSILKLPHTSGEKLYGRALVRDK